MTTFILVVVTRRRAVEATHPLIKILTAYAKPAYYLVYATTAHSSSTSMLNTGVPASRHSASGLRGVILHP
jgi:hypothetical protein